MLGLRDAHKTTSRDVPLNLNYLKCKDVCLSAGLIAWGKETVCLTVLQPLPRQYAGKKYYYGKAVGELDCPGSVTCPEALGKPLSFWVL